MFIKEKLPCQKRHYLHLLTNYLCSDYDHLDEFKSTN
eukprot:UN19668